MKIRFNVGHEKNPSFFEKMLKELGFNPDEFGREGVYNNYLHHLQMGVGATLAFGGTMTPTAKGEETTLPVLDGLFRFGITESVSAPIPIPRQEKKSHRKPEQGKSSF